ncbi:unnamed protein product [Adineta steineri]|uniref:G domain-containing protein n=1 Tax=Adineta steineri TaxID=433720 RepID=A0A813RKP0_9BILA|nr:unnamed protein product [Adineta steineri]
MANDQNTSPLNIKRTAFDSTGHLGSLYDAHRDHILETLNITFEKPPDQYPQKAQCILEKGHINDKRNALELIGIDEQLRLSLLLNLTSKNGITELINYSYPINQYTRIIRYTYIHREEEFPGDTHIVQTWLHSIKPEENATHIITSISWGIDIIVILQLPSDDHLVTMIDDVLEKYRAYLNGDCNEFKLTRIDIKSYTKIADTKIYSNLTNLNERPTLHDIFHSITQHKMNENEHQQLNYVLCPLEQFYSENSNYSPLDLTNNIQLEQYLFDLKNSLNILEAYFNENMSTLLCGHFKEQLTNVYQQWFAIKEEYNKLIEHFSKLIIDIRSNIIAFEVFDEELQNETQIRIKKNIYCLMENVSDLNAKGHLITDLNHQQIQYCNVIERHVDQNDNEDSLKRKLIIDENNDRVLCSNDNLNKIDPEQLKQLRHALVEELDRNPKLRLTYADFSYCNFELSNMVILPISKYYIKKKSTQHQELLLNSDTNSSINSNATTYISLPLSSSPTTTTTTTNESINILLLGETNVGKSTFINAFINYVTFNTIDNIHANKPVVAIPILFPVTVSDDHEKHFVKFGDVHNSKNEDFDHPGQSITQHCKSYVFHPNHSDRRKLRIIDTPGFGDIRGLDQDNFNMQHILEYVQRLSHVNAICILLKSNQTELNPFLQSCLTQLFDFFGKNIRRNIIFCFTNTRSTSYMPGNSALLLEDMLSSFPIRKIPFKKKNTFCFDNESFNYLVALQNHIPYNDQDKQEYETSWINSVREANRLIRYIRKNLIPYPIPNEWECIKRAQIEIVQMIHPILETIRHIFRSIIIRKINSLRESIELHTNNISSHEKQNDSYHSQNLPHQPIPIELLHEYKIPNDALNQKQNEMIDQLTLLCHVSAEFGYFLAYCTSYPNGNPFLTGFFRLITEEKSICDRHNRSYVNIQLVDGLKGLLQNYEQRMKDFKTNAKPNNLSDTQDWIKYMNEYPLISDYVVDNSGSTITYDYESIIS